MIFQGTQTSIAKKPFYEFLGGLPPPSPLDPRMICCRLAEYISLIISKENAEGQVKDKNGPGERKKYNLQNRDSIRRKLEICIESLYLDKHPQMIVNIMKDQIAAESVKMITQ